jgi:hypothetical protein
MSREGGSLFVLAQGQAEYQAIAQADSEGATDDSQPGFRAISQFFPRQLY